MIFLSFLFCFLPQILLLSALTKMREVFSWSSLDFDLPSGVEFIPENNLPVGIEIWRDKLFVTVPRWRSGVPSTLNYVSLWNINERSPKLIPYPDFKSNELGNCENGLSTVYRIKADECDRLWVLDTGTFGIENTTQNPCPYALNIFDLRTNKRIRRYELRAEDITPETFIANIAVDVGGSCNDAFAYMSDELGYGLIVYSYQENTSWRFTHNYFQPDPYASKFFIGGLHFQWDSEGIFGMTLSPRNNNGSRFLFFSPLASNREFAVSTKTLKDASKINSYHDFISLDSRGRDSHVTARVMDDSGVEFLNFIDRNAIACWDSASYPSTTHFGIVERDDEKLIFPSDIKIDENKNVWVISDRMPNFLLSSLDYSDINFRIFYAPVQKLIEGTICKSFWVYPAYLY